tara:strand:+ start:1104 stop:2021 length:918 start_codon:yes stop_codon:yes gene_type:complete
MSKKFINDFKNVTGYLIFGVDRSGTTLTYSILSNQKKFYWFSKIDTKLYRFPKISKLLRNSFSLFSNKSVIAIPDKISKSTGLISPSECIPYWKNIFKWGDENNYLIKDDFFDSNDLNKVDKSFLSEDLNFRINLFKKSHLLIKQPGFSHKLLLLNEIFSNLHFIHVSRKPIDNIYSLVNAKKKSKEKFWGTKIIGWKDLVDEDYFTQATHQVYQTNKLISTQISENDTLKNKYYKVKYESIIENPTYEITKILELCNLKLNDSILNAVKGVVNNKKNYELPSDISDNNKKLINMANELHEMDYR